MTQHRNLRVPGPVWDPARDRAHERGTTHAVIMRSAMRAYAAGLLDDVLAPFIATDPDVLLDGGQPAMPPTEPLPFG